tara:strand:- start:945 stop:1250 length:306 start_codon:yes stop_codon:yes gene_type:complete
MESRPDKPEDSRWCDDCKEWHAATSPVELANDIIEGLQKKAIQNGDVEAANLKVVIGDEGVMRASLQATMGYSDEEIQEFFDTIVLHNAECGWGLDLDPVD